MIKFWRENVDGIVEHCEEAMAEVKFSGKMVDGNFDKIIYIPPKFSSTL